MSADTPKTITIPVFVDPTTKEVIVEVIDAVDLKTYTSSLFQCQFLQARAELLEEKLRRIQLEKDNLYSEFQFVKKALNDHETVHNTFTKQFGEKYQLEALGTSFDPATGVITRIINEEEPK